jgi:hypothetical protein
MSTTTPSTTGINFKEIGVSKEIKEVDEEFDTNDDFFNPLVTDLAIAVAGSVDQSGRQ